MSFIHLLGGVEADRADVLERKLNDISENVGKLAENLINVSQTITEFEERLQEQDHDISEILMSLEEVKASCKKFDRDISTTNCKGVIDQMNNLDRMQRYLMTSHGKALNDIRDLKKELYNLYGRQTPPPEEELKKASDPNPEKKELLDIVKEIEMDPSAKGALIRGLNYNKIETFDDIRNRTFDDLCDLKFFGPINAKTILAIRDKYLGTTDPEPIIKKDIPAYSIRAVLKDENISQKQRSAITNTLYKYGVNTLQDLAKLNYRELETIPHIGKSSMETIRNVYQTYIWK